MDDDNDGIYDTAEGSGDTDGDGIPNYLDSDSDNDGCSDAKEAGFTDANADGMVDGTGVAANGTVIGSDGYTNPADADKNGVADYREAGPDSDGDGIADACEVTDPGDPLNDNDEDGIEDAIDLDDDNDGILDTEEGDADTDGDGIVDSKDADSDGDGCFDVVEAGFTDANNAGIIDGTGIASDGTVLGSDGYMIPIDADNNGISDYQEAGPDSDNDGIADACDENGENPGISKETDIFNVIDAENPTFFIKGIEEYPNNTLSVYNRWGVLVYATSGYNNTWTGISMRGHTISRGEQLPTGTYFYSLDLGDGTKLIVGWLYINQKQN